MACHARPASAFTGQVSPDRIPCASAVSCSLLQPWNVLTNSWRMAWWLRSFHELATVNFFQRPPAESRVTHWFTEIHSMRLIGALFERRR